jgi:hypothetical protein
MKQLALVDGIAEHVMTRVGDRQAEIGIPRRGSAPPTALASMSWQLVG